MSDTNETYTPPVLTLEDVGELPPRPIVYCPFAGDLIHHGHVNIVREGKKHGNVVAALLSDEAIKSYKRTPVVRFKNRVEVLSSIKGVSKVIPQYTHSYDHNLRLLKPDFVVHGSDWRNGVQAKVRQSCIDTIAEWGGKLVEPEYTPNISTTNIIKGCSEHEKLKERSIPLRVDDMTPEEYALEEKIALEEVAREIPDVDALRPISYVAISSDILHHGHIRILKEAAQLGTLVVGILADKAVMSLDEGKKPIVSFQDRVKIYSNITGVAHVVCQNTLSYNFILKALKPDFVIHGSDWSQGPQVEVRKEVIEVLSTFRSRLVEVPYAKFDQIDEWITSSCQERVGSKKKE